MSLVKFTILSTTANQSADYDEIPILMNLDHVVSIKPIRIVVKESVLQGFWIRLSTGKKYKAVKIPEDLREKLDIGNDQIISFEDSEDAELIQ